MDCIYLFKYTFFFLSSSFFLFLSMYYYFFIIYLAFSNTCSTSVATEMVSLAFGFIQSIQDMHFLSNFIYSNQNPGPCFIIIMMSFFFFFLLFPFIFIYWIYFILNCIYLYQNINLFIFLFFFLIADLKLSSLFVFYFFLFIMANVYEMCCINKCALPFCDTTETDYILSKSQKQIQQKIKKNTAVKQLETSSRFASGPPNIPNHEVQGLKSCILGIHLSLTRVSCSSSRWFCSDARWWLGSCHGLPLAAAPDVSPAPPAGVAHLSPFLCHRPFPLALTALSRRRRSSCFSCSRSWKRKNHVIPCIEEITGFTKVKSLIDIHSLRNLVVK